jgi:hypothetical protein
MLPPALQFELRPRRPGPWLRVLLVGLCVGLAVVVALVWWQRQGEVERLERAAHAIQAQVTASSAAPPASQPPAAWMAAAQQDGRLFALEADARLLEIERCTAERATVTRLVHDAAAGVTQVEATLQTGDVLAPLLECLNAGVTGPRRWRLINVAASPVGGAPGALGASLRHE